LTRIHGLAISQKNGLEELTVLRARKIALPCESVVGVGGAAAGARRRGVLRIV
jgi:hypothetical protein